MPLKTHLHGGEEGVVIRELSLGWQALEELSPAIFPDLL